MTIDLAVSPCLETAEAYRTLLFLQAPTKTADWL